MNATVPMTHTRSTPGELLAMARRNKAPTASEETFGQRLARLRKARGFSQTELGELLGVSQRVMTYYERQSERPPAHLLPRLAEVLGVSLEELLGLRPTQDKPAPRNTRLWRKLRQIEKLPPGDRKTVLKILDSLLAQQKMVSSGSGR
ncbi:MAG: helix-turn-helix domain-containing protein [Acidobacteria bacterium]|nr:helix-turn-helix domain-containing protein [Acidobacteriota bacterium]